MTGRQTRKTFSAGDSVAATIDLAVSTQAVSTG